MSYNNIEKYYEEKKHDRVLKEFTPMAQECTEQHILRLFLRSANIIGKKVYDIVNEELMKSDLDYMYNRFIHEKEFPKASGIKILNMILSNDRKDILDEFILMYMEKYEESPVFESLYEYVINNKNKEIIMDYVNSVEVSKENVYFNLVKLILNGKDPVPFLEKSASPEISIASYEHFLKDRELTSETFKKFESGTKFKNEMFVLFENDLYKIEKFEFESRIFHLKDKLGRKKQVNYSVVAEKTNPIEKDDFRVYKFFKPEEARDIEPCRLVTMILKYKNSALDKTQLKDELVYIFGKDASSYITKNKKNLEQCEAIEIIYEKPERFMLSLEEGNLISNKIKRMKTISQVKEYLLIAMKNREIEEDDRERIISHIEMIKDKHKNEILHLVTGDDKYAEAAEPEELKNATYMKFIFDALMKKFAKENISEEDFEIIERLDVSHIEKMYLSLSKENIRIFTEFTQKAFRLAKNLKMIEWYLSYHVSESLQEMDPDYILLRSIMISNDVYAMKKTDEYLNFIRKFLFDPKKEKFLELVKTTNYDTGKRIFDEFMRTLYLNDYQKDEIRRQIYSFRPDYRDYKISDFMLSSQKSIKRKQEEFADITEKTLPKLSKTIQEAAALGDLSENSEYKFAREQYRLFSLRAEELKSKLSKVEPIDFASIKGDKVEAGTVVTIIIKSENREKTYNVLGIFDVDVDNDIISYKSPLVQKILGMKKNEENEEYKILDIKKFKED